MQRFSNKTIPFSAGGSLHRPDRVPETRSRERLSDPDRPLDRRVLLNPRSRHRQAALLPTIVWKTCFHLSGRNHTASKGPWVGWGCSGSTHLKNPKAGLPPSSQFLLKEKFLPKTTLKTLFAFVKARDFHKDAVKCTNVFVD